MNIGFMGGTFSPPHIGHLHSARVFIEEAKLDRLIIIPAKVSPFKVNSAATASDHDRFEMSRLCFLSLNSESCSVEVSDIEISKDKTSYTVETVTELRIFYPDDTIYMFVGSDMFMSLERWKSFEKIFSECRIYTRCRDNGERNAMLDTAQKYRLKYGADVVLSEDNALIASSTEVREALG
ncbi:MAG: nicotinate-nicotinamide nucleotide adenylyltransferase, partial [Clostridia bacterium]|nr:nicotinate-nicotinamide nucleotide adenylyltransferase [Clostridia bacterium]